MGKNTKRNIYNNMCDCHISGRGILHRKEEEDKQKNCILWILAIIGVVAAVAAIAYGVYRFFTPDYLEDFEDDFEDDFDADFFEDDAEEKEKTE